MVAAAAAAAAAVGVVAQERIERSTAAYKAAGGTSRWALRHTIAARNKRVEACCTWYRPRVPGS